jgi:hypothetical protein
MAVLAPIIHTPWSYKQNNRAPEGAREHIHDMLEPIRDWFLQTAVFGALDFGWAPFEIVYEFTNGLIRIKKWKPLLQDYTTILIYENTGAFAGYANEPLQIGAGATAEYVFEKYAMNINLEVEGTDWYGESVSDSLDSIQEKWDAVEKAAGRYDAKIAGASWVIYYPVGETLFAGVRTDNFTIAKNLLSNLESSGGIAVPDEISEHVDGLNDSIEKELQGKWRIELISAKDSSAAQFIDRQKYLDNLKMRAFGLPERSILEGTHGTKAEAESHGSIALGTIDTKHRMICDQVNCQTIDKILIDNYGKEAKGTVWIAPAPLIDMQFNTIREIYRLIIQNPDTLLQEVSSIDTGILRKELGIPSKGGVL